MEEVITTTTPATPVAPVAPHPVEVVKTPGGVPATSHTVLAAQLKGPSLVGKTITSIATFQYGSVFVVDLFCTDNNHYYLKTKQGVLEIGGTQEWDTGTKS